MSSTKKELINRYISEAKKFRFCGPSDDPDEQAAVTTGYNYLVVQIKHLARAILSPDSASRLDSIKVDLDDIYSAYRARAEVDALLPDIESLLEMLNDNLVPLPHPQEPTLSAMSVEKYHVALSFAGEDRDYVERVAARLCSEGVEVFYDKYEEAELWGKDLYTHLRDVYESKALFTVMFVSAHYRDKLWPNHERESAQAKAFESNREYILPAFFDESVKVPGLLRTIGHVSLSAREPEEFAELIIKKLQNSGVQLSSQFAYSDEAKADVDFPRPPGSNVANILNALKSHDWYKQSPAIERIFELEWKSLNKDQIFVLGRNIYQCGCGTERRALVILNNLRERLAGIPEDAAAHLLNGMFFEVYFDKEGQFRGTNIKGECLGQLLSLQSVKKFVPSISFIRRALQPYKAYLPFLPSTAPETVIFELSTKLSDPPTLRSLKLRGQELLVKVEDESDFIFRTWKLSHMKFTVQQLREFLAEVWSIPPEQLEFRYSQKIDPVMEYRLPRGVGLKWPGEGIKP